jgi:hypothetical protein
VLAISQSVCLILAVLTFLGTVVALSGFVARAVWPREEPAAAERADDPNRAYRQAMADLSRRAVQLEQRAVMIESCGLMAGVAVALLAVSLILGAARAVPGDKATAVERLAPIVPGVVALIGAVVIIAVTAPQGRPAAPQGTFPTQPYPVPQAFAPMVSSY